MGDKEEEIPKSVSGINKVRQPVLDFEEINDTDDYTEYTVKTFHIKQGDKEDKNPFIKKKHQQRLEKQSLMI